MNDQSSGANLVVQYEGESDTLWIGNGRPGSIGFDITHNVLISFFDTGAADPNSRIPIGLMLSPAAALLSPHLPIAAIAGTGSVTPCPDKPGLEIRYDAANDTLWMGNGKPADTSIPIVENAAVLYFDAGSEKLSERSIKTPSGVMFYDAVKRLEPAIMADIEELAAAVGRTE